MKAKSSRRVRHVLRSVAHPLEPRTADPSCGYVEGSAIDLPGRVVVGPDMIERINDLEQRVALIEGKL